MDRARQDALEEIAEGYQALCAVVDLVYMGGGRNEGGYLKNLEEVFSDEFGTLLKLIARQIGVPLERIRFAMPRHCIPPVQNSAT